MAPDSAIHRASTLAAIATPASLRVERANRGRCERTKPNSYRRPIVSALLADVNDFAEGCPASHFLPRMLDHAIYRADTLMDHEIGDSCREIVT